MKKTICKVEYDTEASEIVAKYTSGMYGEPDGYEETLYRTEKGNYFIYTNGGAESIHPAENITRLAKNKVDAWMEAHK